MPTISSYAGQLADKVQDYRTRGHKEASKNRPPPDATALDQHESALKSEAEGWVNVEQRLFDTTLTEVSRSSTEARQKAIELRSHIDQLLSDGSTVSSVDAELAGDRPRIVKSTESRIKAEVALKYFRAANNIHEEAHYPDSLPWHFGILLVIALAETVVNTFFYENSQGLLGGFFVALGISILNIGTAMVCGYWFRFQNLAAIDKKIFGWLAIVLFLVTAVFFNALFAAFRTEYQLVADPSDWTQLGEAFRSAWPQAVAIFRWDMEFKDHWSFLLFGVGLLLSLAAFWKGYTLDDRFPGHGRLDRGFKAAAIAEQQEHDKIRQKVKELLHQRSARVTAAIHEPTLQVGMLARRIADLTHARGSLTAQSNAVQRDFAMVSSAYRHANEGVRALPTPAYFAEPPTLQTQVDGSAAEGVIAELTAVQGELNQLAELYRDALNEKLQELQGDTSEILSKTLARFVSEVRQEAEDNIARMTPTIHRVQAA
jgi:hypothetical protein